MTRPIPESRLECWLREADLLDQLPALGRLVESMAGANPGSDGRSGGRT